MFYAGRADERAHELYGQSYEDAAKIVLGGEHGEGFDQEAWHGSPYTFDKFSMDAIGSGEGAQAHGYGLYFAQDKDVSEAYKKHIGAIQGKSIAFNGEIYKERRSDFYGVHGKIEMGTPLYEALANISLTGGVETAIKNIKQHLASCEIGLKQENDRKQEREWYSQRLIDYYNREIPLLNDTIMLLKDSTVHIERTSRLYKVDIPDDDVLLDEQKSYSKQPEKVKENLSRAIKELNKERKGKGLAPIRPGNASGRNLYNTLSEALGGDKEASLYLNEHGIKGITYEGGRDGRCFVVFDDKAVSILNTYNQEVIAPSAEVRLAADEKQWVAVVDKIETTPNKLARVMQTPLVLQLVGVKDLPIYIDTSKVIKIMSDHPEMSPDVLKGLPRALTNPVMILKSDTVSGRMVAILELKGTNNVNVVVPFELEKTRNGLEMNLIKSAYSRAKEENGKPVLDYGWVRKCVNNGGLLYVNRPKAPEVLGMSKQKAMFFLSPCGVQFSSGRKQHSSLALRIPDEGDLVKLREQNPTQYQEQEGMYAGQYSETENLIGIFRLVS